MTRAGRPWVLDRLVIPEDTACDARTHHLEVDPCERVRERDLKQNAIVMAWLVWQAADTAERVPRP